MCNGSESRSASLLPERHGAGTCPLRLSLLRPHAMSALSRGFVRIPLVHRRPRQVPSYNLRLGVISPRFFTRAYTHDRSRSSTGSGLRLTGTTKVALATALAGGALWISYNTSKDFRHFLLAGVRCSRIAGTFARSSLPVFESRSLRRFSL